VTDDLPEHKRLRWHDNRGELSEAIDLLESIPIEVRPYIADALTKRVYQQFQAGEILWGLKSLGRDKIMALHQARKKRRSYDKDVHLAEIATTFFMLSEDVQEVFAKDFLEFTGLVVEYMANCDSFELVLSEEELARMRDTFVESGAAAVQAYLHQIHQFIYDKLSVEIETATIQEPSLVEAKEGLYVKDLPME
jgi:hypothetical protein